MTDVKVGAVAAVTVSVLAADVAPEPYNALAVKLCAATAKALTSNVQTPVLTCAVARPLGTVPSRISTIRPLAATPLRVTAVSTVLPP